MNRHIASIFLTKLSSLARGSRSKWPLLTLFLLASLRAASAVDLSVAGLEITQAAQTTSNTIQLVAQRSTAVRATLAVTGTGASVPNVTGRLHIFVDGAEITPAAGLLPINAPFTAPLAPQRSNQNDALNFELLAPSDIPASANVDFQVDIDPVPGETNTANNSGAANNLSFAGRSVPLLFFTRIDYTPSGLGLPSDALIQPGTGNAMVRGIFPINDGDPTLYQQGLFPSLTYTEDSNGDGILDGFGTDGGNLIDLLESCRQLIVDSGVGASDRIFLYGWLAGNPVSTNGLGQVVGHVAFGNTQAARYQRTYTHELGHNFGFGDDGGSSLLDEVGWDVGARLPGNPAGNNVAGRVKSMTLFDIMVPGKVTNQAWVRTNQYNTLLAHPWLSLAAPDLRTRVLVVRGIFDRAGRELTRLNPAFRFPWRSAPSRLLQNTRLYEFAARVRDSGDNLTAMPFTALVGDDAGNTSYGTFQVMIPVSPQLEVELLEITNLGGETIFGRLARTLNPPQIQVLLPQDGARLGNETNIRWNVVDSDSPLNSLQYQVAYSPDDGLSWVPIAVNLEGTRQGVAFDSTQIQQSNGRGVIRVFVSDGLNTAFSDVRGLTTLAARYPAPQPPQIGRISIFNANVIIRLQSSQGKRYQLQRADLFQPATDWVNVGAPQLGTGNLLELADPQGASVPQRFYRVEETLLP